MSRQVSVGLASHLLESVERVCEHGVRDVILGKLRHQLLELSVEQLRICHALMVDSVAASTVSLWRGKRMEPQFRTSETDRSGGRSDC